MGALVNLTAADGATTPVTHTFVPLGPDSNGIQWFEQTSPAPANAAAAKRISISIKRAKVGQSLTGVAKIVAQIWCPVMETVGTSDSGITPPPTVAYTLFARIEYFMPERSTEQERQDLRVIAANLIANNQIIRDLIARLQPLY